MDDKSVLIKTIVTSELGADIAVAHGAQVMNVLTGFKYIGEKMIGFAKNHDHHFIMGYEESYGYLVGEHARDKDAVVASMLICEMAAYQKAQGKTLLQRLGRIVSAAWLLQRSAGFFYLAGRRWSAAYC